MHKVCTLASLGLLGRSCAVLWHLGGGTVASWGYCGWDGWMADTSNRSNLDTLILCEGHRNPYNGREVA